MLLPEKRKHCVVQMLRERKKKKVFFSEKKSSLKIIFGNLVSFYFLGSAHFFLQHLAIG